MASRSRTGIGLALALAIACPAVGARAASGPAALELNQARARRHFARGQSAWLADDYETAQRELELAYQVEPNPDLLYALAQLARIQDDCDRARELYLRYLESDPPTEQAQDALINIERCKPEPSGATPTPPSTPPAPRLVSSPPDRPRSPPPPTAPRRPDALGVALTTVGAALAASGAVLVGVAFSQRSRADEAFEQAEFERQVRTSTIEHATGWSLVGVGSALLVGGIVRLSLVKRRRRDRRLSP